MTADVLRFRFRGEEYEFAMRLLVHEARTIKKLAGGMGATDFFRGLASGDPDAYVALLYLAKKRAGEPVKWGDFDDVDLLSEIELIDDGEPAGDGDGGEGGAATVDPTPAGTTPTRASSAT